MRQKDYKKKKKGKLRMKNMKDTFCNKGDTHDGDTFKKY